VALTGLLPPQWAKEEFPNMIETAAKVLDTTDAEAYLQIVTTFMHSVTGARTITDIVIAAGIAEEELIMFRDDLLFNGNGAPERLRLIAEAEVGRTSVTRLWEPKL
jgi:hypothetical protein